MLVSIIFTLAITALLTFLFFDNKNKCKEDDQKIKDTAVLGLSDITKAADQANQSQNKSAKPKPKSNPKPKPTKAPKIPEFKHENLLTNLKSHSDRVSSISLSENEKFLFSCSDDRSFIQWPVKNFNKGNNHIKINIEMDRATSVSSSPDGKLVSLGLDFGNAVRVYQVGGSANGNSNNFKTLPVLDENNKSSTLQKQLFGYNCNKRNSLKETKNPFLISLYSGSSTNTNKPKIFVTDMTVLGQNLQGSPIDPALGKISNIKLNSTKNFFGVAGSMANFNFYCA